MSRLKDQYALIPERSAAGLQLARVQLGDAVRLIQSNARDSADQQTVAQQLSKVWPCPDALFANAGGSHFVVGTERLVDRGVGNP
ncbi:hypothetical protein NJC38_16520 [Pseudomonas sp. 21LCFQ010]|uniref:hypothetical protein n=1 Tax=Pseudomonas sp. 21LCFQ010 TaxID=2957506 RepID=UPI002096C0C3|nr:hypothetical protein [Pseudomonas sp. 21LCFQ010]MCO8163759.1 hypothetical protein [Pseudomonas sp. 21LCFQ010]